MQFIDSDADHCDRGKVDIKHVYDMVELACRKADGTIVQHPHFEQLTWNEQYDYCICGKEIVYNYVAQCVETGKCFIVGSDCIETVCINKHFDLKNKCCMCKNNYTPTLTAKYCINCKSLRQTGRSVVGFGKHKELTYLKLYLSNPEYCNFIYEGTSNSPKVQKFKNWYEEIKDININNSSDSDSEPERINLHVPYEKKDDARTYGAKWDKDQKTWYIFSNSPALNILLQKYKKK